ncbi:Ig-like domain-containing protein [Clostridium sp. DL1XJH146]
MAAITNAEAHKYIRLKLTATDDGVGTPSTESSSAYSVWRLVENTAPIAEESTLTTDEDTAKSAQLAGSDVDLDSLTYIKVTDPSHGTVVVNANGSYTYTPNANFNGEDSFTFKVNDGVAASVGGALDSNVATITITVNALNDAPVNTVVPSYSGTMKVGQELTADKGTWNDIIDTDVSGTSEISYEYQWEVATDINGTDSANIDGAISSSFEITAAEAHKYIRVKVTGTDSGVGPHSTQSTIAYSVWKLVENTAPIASDGILTTEEDTEKTGNLVGNDADGDTLTYSKVTDPSHGTVVVNANGSYTYTPNANYNGEDSFTFKVNDGVAVSVGGALDSNVATITITVNAVNDAPIASNGTLTTDEDTVKSGNLIGSDVDRDANGVGDILTYSKVDDPLHGSVIVRADGSYTYTPNANYNGTDSFTFKVNDGASYSNEGELDSNISTITITVNALNDAPVNTVVPSYSGTMKVGQELTADKGTWNDIIDTDVSGTSEISYEYKWEIAKDINGTDSENIAGAISSSFEITATEAHKYIRVKVTGTDSGVGTPSTQSTIAYSVWKLVENTAPIASDGILTTDEDTEKEGNLVGRDVDGESLTYSKITDPSHGSVSVTGEGNYIYTPDADYNGTDSFTYSISDGTLDSNVAMVNINVIHHESTVFITLTSNPTSIVGNGVETAILTTNIFDSNNEPVIGVEVKFNASFGSFPDGKTAITDENGIAEITFKAPKIEGIESVVELVKAKVIDSSKNLYAYNELQVTFEPSSIQGIVIDNDLKFPVEGAIVEVSKDFDGDGIVDFYAKMITAADGKYKIAVPKGNVNYDVFITKPVKIGNEIKEVTFNQSCPIGSITGVGSDIFDAGNSIGGLVLIKTPDESTKALEEYDKYTVKIRDSEGNIKYAASLNSNSLYQADGLEKGKTYDLAVTYSLGNGEEIVVGESKVTVKSNGEINISTILIDPYGIITDADTREVIEGAKVVLYYANTQRNIDSGKIPDTEVDLPIIKGFEPSDNANPQFSNYLGQYAYMVFPNTDYYIVSVKSGYETFISETIIVNEELVQYNFEMKKENKAITEEKINSSENVLPKTGVLFDNELMFLIGILFVILGTFLYFFSKRIKNN